jgi:hypothetical protein
MLTVLIEEFFLSMDIGGGVSVGLIMFEALAMNNMDVFTSVGATRKKLLGNNSL